MKRTHPFLPPHPGSWSRFAFTDLYQTRREGLLLTPDEPSWTATEQRLDHLSRRFMELFGSELPEADVRTEAAAIVACCWRYGSYIDLLTRGEAYRPFLKRPSLSRIGDSEMKRIQLEFTSSLARWLTLRDTDRARINARVLAAGQLFTLRVPDMTPAALQRAGASRRDEHLLWLKRHRQHHSWTPSQVQDFTAGARAEANQIVHHFYRMDSPLEDLHAGQWNPGKDLPGFRRFYGTELEDLGDLLTARLAAYLYGRNQSHVRDVQALALTFPSTRWSLTENTCATEYLGVPRGEVPATRLYGLRGLAREAWTLMPGQGKALPDPLPLVTVPAQDT